MILFEGKIKHMTLLASTLFCRKINAVLLQI